MLRVCGGQPRVGGAANKQTDTRKWAKAHPGGVPPQPVVTPEEQALFKDTRDRYMTASSAGLVLKSREMALYWNQIALDQRTSPGIITIHPKHAWHLEDYDKDFVVHEQHQQALDTYRSDNPNYAAHMQQVHQRVLCPIPKATVHQPIAHGLPTPAYAMPQNCGITSTWNPQQVQYAPGPAATSSHARPMVGPNPNRQAAHANRLKTCKTCKQHKVNSTGHFKGICHADLPPHEWPEAIRPHSADP